MIQKEVIENDQKHKISILFVDDDAICHNIAHLIINHLTDYRLMSAYNGKEAIEFATRFSKEIGLIILDIMLPDYNGFRLFKNIRKIDNLAHIPIIFQTGIKGTNISKILNDNTVQTIYKPYSNNELIDLIQQTITKVEAISA